jgi:hypothetical protein
LFKKSSTDVFAIKEREQQNEEMGKERRIWGRERILLPETVKELKKNLKKKERNSEKISQMNQTFRSMRVFQ